MLSGAKRHRLGQSRAINTAANRMRHVGFDVASNVVVILDRQFRISVFRTKLNTWLSGWCGRGCSVLTVAHPAPVRVTW